MINLLFHDHDFGVPAEWHYFATAHGKGPSDGLGGTLKRLATRASLQGTTIETPKELHDWALENCNLNVKFVSAEQCLDEKKIWKDRFESALPIPGIRSMHAATPSGVDTILMKPVSSSSSVVTFKIVSGKHKIKIDPKPKNRKTLHGSSLIKRK